MSFELIAPLLLRADHTEDGRILAADERWAFRRPDAGMRAIVWGREPSYERARPHLLLSALRRERTVAALRTRPPSPLAVTAVHRWPQRFYRARVAPRLIGRLRQGVVVELAAEHSAPRILDTAAQTAGSVRAVPRFHIGAGGSVTARILLADGSERVLCVGLADSPADPAASTDALARLEPLGLRCVPAPKGRGRVGPASWSAESLLPGQPPPALTPGLARELTDFTLRLPREDGPPTAFGTDMDTLAQRLPLHTSELGALRSAVEPAVAALPSVMRHGDLWAGNLLVDRGTFAGVVDWDGWHPAAVPGTDLLHAVAADEALATRRGFARLLFECPWEAPAFRDAAARYWPAFGIDPRPGLLHAVGVAWWAGQTARSLHRSPGKARVESWLADNVAPVLDRVAELGERVARG